MVVYLGKATPASGQGGGSGGAAVWGAITGTLSNQTDLQNALDAKANTADLSAVATSGSYTDLSNKPTIPSVDKSTINTNASDKLQAIGVINPQTETALRIWNGTESEWNNGGEIDQTYYGFGASKDNNRVWYSSDGETWTQATMPETRLESMVYGNGKFVAVGYSSNAYSTDGINWTAVSSPYYSVQSVAYGNNMFVAVYFRTDNYAYSSDGITWTQATMPVSADWTSVVYVNNTFIALSYMSEYRYSSADGINWELYTGDFPIAKSYAYGNNTHVIINENNRVYYSSDGETWTQATMPVSADWTSVVYADGKFATINTTGCICYSTDGITWTQAVYLKEGENWNSLAYGDGKLIAASQYYIKQYYTLEEIPTTSSVLYAYDGTTFTPSGINIIEVVILGHDINLRLENEDEIYTKDYGENEYSHHTIGYSYPNWLCNINGVGVKIGNTMIAEVKPTGASGTYTTADNKTVTVTNGVITEITANS